MLCLCTSYKAHHIGRVIAAVIILLLPMLIFLSYVDFNSDALKAVNFDDKLFPISRYLINTTNCRIPDLDPLNDEVLPFIAREEYESCSKKPLMTYIQKHKGEVKLKVNQTVIALYSSFSVKCCYSYILRKDADSSVMHTTCEHFESEVNISYPYVRVTCRNIFGVVYQNVHATIIPKDFDKNIALNHNNSTNKWKVFMIGIDSMSKLNLQRTMPKVYSYLETNFIGFRGYNKIEDNTFPNVMAILTGRSMDTLSPICLRNETFDDCDIIWKSFQKSGYITAYGEDETFLNTFNYFKEGFLQPPTSIYLRPYFLSAYLLPITYKHFMGVCTGPENTAERMFNAAKDFQSTFKDSPTFTLYWLNSFSHDNVNFPTTMNDKLMDFLTDPVITDAMNDSILIVFSDHGFRFGDIRFTYSGWLEERLPFLYFKLPEPFQKLYPHLAINLTANAQNRLTTPYDLHMTLQHILKLSNNSYKIKPSLGCFKCKSLFETIEELRTCEDAGIPQHWCTCNGYTRMHPKSHEVIKVAEYVVDQINQLVSSFIEEGQKCAKYILGSIETVGKSKSACGEDGSTNTYLILLKTYPYAMFEATVRTRNKNFDLLGQISRLNKYGAYSSCIHNDVLKKYCFCDSWTTKILSKLCYLFKCHIY